MLDEEMVYDLADLFKIFSDSTRLKILCSLFDGNLNVTEITAATGVSQTTETKSSCEIHKIRQAGCLFPFR